METQEKIDKIQQLIIDRKQLVGDLDILKMKECQPGFSAPGKNTRKFKTVLVGDLSDFVLELAKKRMQDKIEEYDNKIDKIGQSINLEEDE